MSRKRILIAAAALLAAFLAGWAALRPVTVHVDGQTITVRGAIFTTGGALERAGVRLARNDRIEPGWESLVPLDGQILVTRAVDAQLWQQGKLTRLSGQAATAQALLEANGIRLSTHDRLLRNGSAIDPRQPLPRGETLVLQLIRARTVIIDREGKREAIETTAATAGEALWQAGIRPRAGDQLSMPAETLLEETAPGGAPVTIAYRAAQPLTIRVGEREVRARSTAQTVGEALAAAGIALQGLDYAEPAEDQPIPADRSIRVVRVREEIALTEELIPFTTERVPDPDTEFDQTRVLKAGQYGVKVTRERARFEDGEEIRREIDSDWTASEPVAQTVGVGTKVVTKTADVGGATIEYWRAISVYATSYSPCRLGLGDDRCSWSTSSGMRLRKGIIAVTLAWYRQIAGLRVYVPGYGEGVIADVGGGIPGTPWIDLGFDESDYQPIVGWTTLYFLTPAPDNPNLVLP